jgi:hypothetical protein
MRAHGPATAHRATLNVSEPGSEGFFTVTVTHSEGKVITSGYGDDVADALLGTFLALLPPDHPDFDTGPTE